MRALRGRRTFLKKNWDINKNSYLYSRKVKKSLVKRLGVDTLSPKEHFYGKKFQVKQLLQKFTKSKVSKVFALLLYFFEISIFYWFWVMGTTFLLILHIFRKSKGSKVFALLFTFCKVLKRKDATPSLNLDFLIN